MGRAVRAVLVVVFVTGATALPARASTTTSTAPRVYVYGDSLLDEAKAYIDLSGTVGFVHGTVGQAPCDYLKALRRTLAVEHHVALIVIESAANSSSSCMLEPGSTTTYMPIGSPEWEQRYESDYDEIFALAAASDVRHVLVIAPPPMDPTQTASAVRNDLIRTVWPWLRADVDANYPRVHFTADPRNAVGGHTFTSTMPCLPDETAADGCSHGTITVRAPDGLHFCPTGLQNQKEPCALAYDPGARRFGNAIEAVTRAHI